MKKEFKIIITILAIIIILALIILIVVKIQKNITTVYNSDDTKEYELSENIESDELSTKIAVVVKVNDNSLIVHEPGKSEWRVSFSEEGDIGFKQGQEVKIYYTDEMINSIYPAPLYDVEKIEIIKEESDIPLSDDLLSHWYSSVDNVSVIVNEFTRAGITFMITDTNDIPFKYTNEYRIDKKVKNPNYTGKGTYTEATETSTSSFTGKGFEYLWEELNRSSEVSRDDTVEVLSYNLPNKTEDKPLTITGRRIDWSKFYGELDEGEYSFELKVDSSKLSCIYIFFKVNENGEITYEKPKIEY